ncbi:ankyrin [Pleomassaria siparia CBS 279.74]|uniref:Ankyrin n=1 Tax=Pleomassaria siparia CBS 279.74 TaxID=1314801 RepID=A0A6G1JTW8_9PLEO|nr:ankyrin [Pleomassaria siparia CBS 279.74]
MNCRRRRKISHELWERHKDNIGHLFLVQKKALKGDDGLINAMQRDYGFFASKAQFKTRLKKWGLGTYATQDEWRLIDRILISREGQGKSTEVYLHGELLRDERVRKGRRGYRQSEISSVNESAFIPITPLPASISIKTPTMTTSTVALRSRPNTPTNQYTYQRAQARDYQAVQILPSPQSLDLTGLGGESGNLVWNTRATSGVAQEEHHLYRPISPVDPVHPFEFFYASLGDQSCSANPLSFELDAPVGFQHIPQGNFDRPGGTVSLLQRLDRRIFTFVEGLVGELAIPDTVCRGSLGMLCAPSALLLQSGFLVEPHGYHLLFDQNDPRVFDTLVQEIHGANEFFIKSGLLSRILQQPNNDTINRAVSSILGRPWSIEFRKTRIFNGMLTSSLSNAAYQQNTEVFNSLLESGAIPSTSCLSNAVRGRHLVAIDRLLDLGVDPTKCVGRSKSSHWDWELNRIGHECLLSPIAEGIRENVGQALDAFSRRGCFTNIEATYSAESVDEIVTSACETGNEIFLDMFLPYWKMQPYWTNRPRYYADTTVLGAAIKNGHDHLIPKLLSRIEHSSVTDVYQGILTRNPNLVRHLLNLQPPGLEISEALHYAVVCGNLDIVEDLIQAGTLLDISWDENISDRETVMGMSFGGLFDTPWALITTAIFAGNRIMIHYLHNKGAPLHSRVRGSDVEVSPLSAATYGRDLDLVRELLSWGADPYDSRAISFATSNHDYDLVAAILEAFGPRYAGKKQGFAHEALCIAVRSEDMRLIEMLLRYVHEGYIEPIQYHVQSVYKEVRTSALGLSIMSKTSEGLEIIRSLAAHGADMNGIVQRHNSDSVRNHTALMHAIFTKELSKVQELVRLGAKIDLPARFFTSRTPLQFAVELGVEDIVHYLLMQGASPNEPPAVRKGGTALQFAAAGGHMGIASLLLSVGADVNAPANSIFSRTAFEDASANGRLDMMSYLMENGADIVADDGKQYKTAVKLAEKNGHYGAKALANTLYASACLAAGRMASQGLDEGLLA